MPLSSAQLVKQALFFFAKNVMIGVTFSHWIPTTNTISQSVEYPVQSHHGACPKGSLCHRRALRGLHSPGHGRLPEGLYPCGHGFPFETDCGGLWRAGSIARAAAKG